jgi:hypothetical protein
LSKVLHFGSPPPLPLGTPLIRKDKTTFTDSSCWPLLEFPFWLMPNSSSRNDSHASCPRLARSSGGWLSSTNRGLGAWTQLRVSQPTRQKVTIDFDGISKVAISSFCSCKRSIKIRSRLSPLNFETGRWVLSGTEVESKGVCLQIVKTPTAIYWQQTESPYVRFTQRYW